MPICNNNLCGCGAQFSTFNEYAQHLKRTRNRRNKFGAKKTEYRGRTFDSQAEAKRAAYLDTLTKTGNLTFWLPQPVVMGLGAENLTYRPDFICYRAAYGDAPADCWFEDVKGVETAKFRQIRKLWAAHGPGPLLVIKLRGGRWQSELVA